MWIYDHYSGHLIRYDDYYDSRGSYYYYYHYRGEAALAAGLFLTISLIICVLIFCCLYEERPAERYTYVYPQPRMEQTAPPSVLRVKIPPDGRPIEKVILVQQGSPEPLKPTHHHHHSRESLYTTTDEEETEASGSPPRPPEPAVVHQK